MVTPAAALPGRTTPMTVPVRHFVNGAALEPPFPAESEELVVGMGCFWGAERLFWKIPGVISTSVGYAGGYTSNPNYEEVCSGQTGHAEVVRVIYGSNHVTLQHLLNAFWEEHNPTQGMRQGNDIGSQYRSCIYCTSPVQLQIVLLSCEQYQGKLSLQGFSQITTEIRLSPQFFYAEDYHQQYLAKNPNGYCGLVGTGVRCKS
ncbi:MAG: peptide-methionine (S)-S-oxide reductase MsrA [Gammaproteobacteria bacterium]|nr:peptide-methionine (S)-S-oxide reductase MsrA [Gammaproteobacteria bacterium]